MSVPNALIIIDRITEIAVADHTDLDPLHHAQARAVQRESFLSEPWGKWKKKGRNELYLCIWRRKKKPTTVEQYLCVRRMKKKPIAMKQYLCVRRRKKKLIGCLVGLGNLPGTQLLSGVTGRVEENSIYIRPFLGTGEEVEWRPPLLWSNPLGHRVSARLD